MPKGAGGGKAIAPSLNRKRPKSPCPVSEPHHGGSASSAAPQRVPRALSIQPGTEAERGLVGSKRFATAVSRWARASATAVRYRADWSAIKLEARCPALWGGMESRGAVRRPNTE